MKWNWIPNVGVNDLEFDKQYLNKLEQIGAYRFYAEELDHEEIWEGETEEILISFDVDNPEVFISMEIFSNLFYKDNLLIGLNKKEVLDIFNDVDDWMDDVDGYFFQSYKLETYFGWKMGKSHLYLYSKRRVGACVHIFIMLAHCLFLTKNSFRLPENKKQI